MAKSLTLTQLSLNFLNLPKTPLSLKPHSHYFSSNTLHFPPLFNTTKTRNPLQYEMILSTPVYTPPSPHSHNPNGSPEESIPPVSPIPGYINDKSGNIDKAKRKYYRKKMKKMYGEDPTEERKRNVEKYIELKQEVVKFKSVHQREEELYFYDTFAYPWDKDKHYRMVYNLEKKYYPDQCFDKAFIEPGEEEKKKARTRKNLRDNIYQKNDDDEKKLMFFESEEEGKVKWEGARSEDNEEGFGLGEKDKKEKDVVGVIRDVTERKVEDFFKGLKNENRAKEVGYVEPFISTRSTGLPGKWDSPNGTMVLVNKPKGWTSFTVCGKLRRLVNVQKVGHAGTLDPMATGLLIVCVGKATKVVDRFQGMIKGYSGVFRLGEATSTWDADSPVIQRESWEHIKDDSIQKNAASFCGDIWQVPPMFSAIKVGGEKMYEKARRGETVELSPRRITIFEFQVERSLNDRQNIIFRVVCSKGTYIRSLCADYGKSLGSCAHLTALRRDSIGEYLADDAWEFKELEEAVTKGYL